MITSGIDDFSKFGVIHSNDIFFKWFNWIYIIGVKVREKERIDPLKLHLLKHLNEIKILNTNIDKWGNSLFNLFLMYKVSNNVDINELIRAFSIYNDSDNEFLLPLSYMDVLSVIIDKVKEKIIDNIDFDEDIYKILSLLLKSSLLVLDCDTLYSRLLNHSKKRTGFNVDEKGIITTYKE